MIAVCDVDDLLDHQQIEDLLVPIKRKVPDWKVTCYTVPNRFGRIEPALRARYDWITFGIHGWEHTPFECLTWTDADTEDRIKQALRMGYDPIFKAPNWVSHAEILLGCRRAGVVFHHHPGDSRILQGEVGSGLRLFPAFGPLRTEPKWVNVHTHILRNPVTDFIGDHPGFLPENLIAFDSFGTPIEYARPL